MPPPPSDEPSPIPVLGVATIFHAAYVLRCIRSIDFHVETLVLVHNGEDAEVGAAVATLQRERPAMRVVRVPENSGCAGGWNRIVGANLTAPWWLVVNDDIAFPPGALRNIASRVWARVRSRAHADEGHFKFWYQHGATGWSAFALTARAVREAGRFDENIYPVYFEDQDFEWRLGLAGLRSVHVRDVLVVHGSEDADEYESGSLVALANGTGGEALRADFTRHLLRGANARYMVQKWGAIKPASPAEPERRWRTPFNRQLPVGWWELDGARRGCIRERPSERPADEPADDSPPPASGATEPPPAACPFDERLADEAAAKAAPRRTSSFGRRLASRHEEL